MSKHLQKRTIHKKRHGRNGPIHVKDTIRKETKYKNNTKQPDVLVKTLAKELYTCQRT